MRLRRRFVRGLALLALVPLSLASDHLGISQDFVRDALVASAPSQVVRGAETFDRNCAVCHGDSALGIHEAKLAFPEDHRHCTRCHKPNNPVVMSLAEVVAQGRDHDLFSIGDPPALRGDGALASFPTASALFHYTQATMPRYRPGTMDRAELLDVTAFLWFVNGRTEEFEYLDVVLHPRDVGLAD